VTPTPEAHRQWQVRHQGAWEAVEEAVRYTEDEHARATIASQGRASTYTARIYRQGIPLGVRGVLRESPGAGGEGNAGRVKREEGDRMERIKNVTPRALTSPIGAGIYGAGSCARGGAGSRPSVRGQWGACHSQRLCETDR
jgi:hypothetical protein